MQDVWNPILIRKIDSFMERKAREFPELKLSGRVSDVDLLPNRTSKTLLGKLIKN